MLKKTNELLDQIKTTNLFFDSVSRDIIITSGENISAGLFSAQLNNLGVNAAPICGWQIPIKIENQEIVDIGLPKLEDMLNNNVTPIVTGFQGINKDGFISSLKRGGSDTTATALAAAFKADICYIYTDIGGVYEISPELVEIDSNYHISKISYEQMYEMSLNGAKVMSSDSIGFAKKMRIPIEVRCSFDKIITTENCTIVEQTTAKNSAFLISNIGENKYRIYCVLEKSMQNEIEIIKFLLLRAENPTFSNSGFTFDTNDKQDPLIYELLLFFKNQLRNKR